MAIRDFELFHGAVLARILRKGRRVALTMIETKPAESWSAYRINDVASLYVKYCAAPDQRKRDEALVWQFTFDVRHLEEVARLQQEGDVYVALVGGNSDVKRRGTEICLLYPGEFGRCVDVGSPDPQSICVVSVPRRQLLARGGGWSERTEIKVPRDRLSTLEVPGS